MHELAERKSRGVHLSRSDFPARVGPWSKIADGIKTFNVEIKPQRAYALSLLDEQLNFAPPLCEALH